MKTDDLIAALAAQPERVNTRAVEQRVGLAAMARSSSALLWRPWRACAVPPC